MERITLANTHDLPKILEIYSKARAFMAANGNPTQWGVSNYPDKELLRLDIKMQRLWTIRDEEKVLAVFALIIGEDPTYVRIEHGNWLNNRPYGTIHRLASSGVEKGMAKLCIDHCYEICRENSYSLRADTHADNHIMQKILVSNGFEYCGIIHVKDESTRLAYQKD